jgi:hypothetical protein
MIDTTIPAIPSQPYYNHQYRWLLSKWKATKNRYSAYGPTKALGNLAHGIHLSHGSIHVTKMGITGMAGAKISQSTVDIA